MGGTLSDIERVLAEEYDLTHAGAVESRISNVKTY
jgi:hypothetical protein